MNISPLNRFDRFSCVRSSVILQLRFKIRKLQSAMRAIPPFHGIDCVLFLLSTVWYTHSDNLSHFIFYRTDMPTPRGEPFMAVAVCSAQCFWSTTILIHNHTTFKCYIAFSNIITSCGMPPCIPFTIHLVFNAWCLIICQREHRNFEFRLDLNAHWSVTD